MNSGIGLHSKFRRACLMLLATGKLRTLFVLLVVCVDICVSGARADASLPDAYGSVPSSTRADDPRTVESSGLDRPFQLAQRGRERERDFSGGGRVRPDPYSPRSVFDLLVATSNRDQPSSELAWFKPLDFEQPPNYPSSFFDKAGLLVGGESYELDIGKARGLQATVAGTGWNNLIVQRISRPKRPGAPAIPLYILYHGSKHPDVFQGNAALAQLNEAVLASSVEHFKSLKGPVVWMTGEGSEQDFDAAMLTMGLGNPNYPVEHQPPGRVFFRGTFDNVRVGRLRTFDPRGVSIVLEDGIWKASQPIDGGELRVAGRTRDAVAVVLAALRKVLAAFFAEHQDALGQGRGLTAQQKAELLDSLQAESRAALSAYYAANGIGEADRDRVQVSDTIGLQLSNWVVADILSPRGIESGRPSQNLGTAGLTRRTAVAAQGEIRHGC